MSGAERLAIGTAQFGLSYGVANVGGQVPLATAAEVLRCARAAGVDTIDTAVAYGDSEARLGEIGVEGWQVVTKLPPLPEGVEDAAAWVHATVTGSLTRLGVVRLHGLLLHRPSDLLGAHGRALADGLVRLRDTGFVARTGVSIYEPSELDALWGRAPIDLVQAPFNVLDRRLSESGWLARLAGEGVEVHTRSAFLQGLLLFAEESRPASFARWAPIWRRWHDWLRQHSADPVAACLAFVAGHEQIARLVVGVETPAQFEQIVRACGQPTPSLPDFGPSDPDLVDPSRWTRE